MSKTQTTDALPAPVSLTLEEASAIVSGGYSLTMMPWWWFGQPAYLSAVSQVVTPVLNQGAIAGAAVAQF